MPLEQFRRLAVATTKDELVRLRGRVMTHLDLLEEEALDSADVDRALARRLCIALLELSGDAAQLSAQERAWVGGAMRYFVKTDDVDNDLALDGLVDDALVVNEVCDRLGRPDLKIV